MNFTFDYKNLICKPIYAAWSCTYILLLPVFIFIICVGIQRWRKHSSSTTHSDVFTFHMCAVEVCGILGNCFNVVGFYIEHNGVLIPGQTLSYMATFGQILLHVLVSLERYIAVVHPITYLCLKKRGAVIRNVGVAVVWLFSFSLGCMWYSFRRDIWLMVFIIGTVCLVSVSFLCAGVLCVLIRAGPGDRKHVDQSKRRAFHTILAITVALMLKLVSMFVSMSVYWSHVIHKSVECLMTTFVQFLYIPSSLVMPVLFLYRRGKQCKKNLQEKSRSCRG